jgi:hypothetical protein
VTNGAARTVLRSTIAAGVALATLVALLPRAHDPASIVMSGASSHAVQSAMPAQLAEPPARVAARDGLEERDPAPGLPAGSALAAQEAAVRALAQRLGGDRYQRTTFETEARARAASLPDWSLAGGFDPEPTLWVARGVLARVAPATLDERRAAVRELLPALRASLADESLPRAVAEQAAATLAALGEDADRARLFADVVDATSPRAAQAARFALECLEGPRAGPALVEAAASDRADGPFLDAIPAWMRAHSASLAPDERASCAGSIRAIVDDPARDASSRARALAGLRALDPEQAAIASLQWLRDPESDSALVRAACGSVRSGGVDLRTAADLACDATVPAEVRREIAAAFLGSAGIADADPALVAEVAAIARP